MPRKQSDSEENIARFFSNLAAHLDTNNGVFLEDSLTLAETKRAQKDLAALANKYWEAAAVHRTLDR